MKNKRKKPAVDRAKKIILKALVNGEMPAADLAETALLNGVSETALRRAKTTLKKENKIQIRNEGFGTDKVFFYSLSIDK